MSILDEHFGGQRFQCYKFQGLESFTLKSSEELDNTFDFFRVVGPGLKYLEIDYLPEGMSVPGQICNSLKDLNM